jgi:hypothetical protein
MTGKGILPEHEAECSIESIVRHFPRHKRPVRKIRCQKSLTDPPDRPRGQHGLDPVQDYRLLDTRQSGNLAKRFTHKSLDPVFRDGEDLRINGVGVLDRNHLRRS